MRRPRPKPREVPPQELSARPFSGFRQQAGGSPLFDRLGPLLFGSAIGSALAARLYYGEPEVVNWTRGGTDHPLFTGVLFGITLGVLLGTPLMLRWKTKRLFLALVIGLGGSFLLTLLCAAAGIYFFPPGSL